MRICHVVASLDERTGGPSKSVHALSRALAELGHTVELCALAPTGAGVRQDGPLTVRTFLRGQRQMFAQSSLLARHLRLTSFDVIHHHALWLRTLHYARRAAESRHAPLVVSPRGMMNRWAWRHHRWRKWLAGHLVHPHALQRTTGWHATSDDEVEDIRALGFQQPACVSPNGVEATTSEQTAAAVKYWRETCPEVINRPTALFYSRFHCKKRVLELIDLWLARAPREWLLLMVGVPEEYTPAQLEAYVMRASGAGRVRVYDGVEKPPPYAVSSLLLLPSHSENFGMVIAEAMAAGVPTVVTDATPWSMLNERGLGWCVPWESYGDALVAALQEAPLALAARGAAARPWVLNEFSWLQGARRLTAFYEELIAAKSRPPGSVSSA